MLETGCVWCGNRKCVLDKDHVFPRSIGGTKELYVWACRDCQTTIGKAEQEFSRRSEYALFLVEGGPRGRDKRRPQSGVIRTEYVLVPHPQGGYSESEFIAGQMARSIPYLEIDVTNKRARRRAPSRADFDRMLHKVRELLGKRPGPNGLICEIDVFTHDLGDISRDSDFWPRIALGAGDRLFIRARNPEEARQFINIFVVCLRAGVFDGPGDWQDYEIKGGTQHTVCVKYDRSLAYRVFGKIAAGLLFTQIKADLLHLRAFEPLRSFVRGLDSKNWRYWVTEICPPGSVTDWQEHHVGAVVLQDQTLIGVLSICGGVHKVEIAKAPRNFSMQGVIAARSRLSGTRTEVLRGADALALADRLVAYLDVDRGSQAMAIPSFLRGLV